MDHLTSLGHHFPQAAAQRLCTWLAGAMGCLLGWGVRMYPWHSIIRSDHKILKKKCDSICYHVHHVTPHKVDGPVPVASWWALASCLEAITEIIPPTLILNRCYEHLHSHLFLMLINYIKLLSRVSSGPISYPPISASPCVQCFLRLPSTPLNPIQPLPSNPYPTLHSYYIPIIVSCTPYMSMIFPRHSLQKLPCYPHEFIPMWYYIPTRFSFYSHYIFILCPLYVDYISIILP